MRLESLANELLINLFDYLNIKDLFHAFFQLNHRFKQLVFNHCQLRGHLDFQSISQTTFHAICQECLPDHLMEIRSIHLSDDDETPEQMSLFFNHYFQLSHLKNLRCLSLNSISSESIITYLVVHLPELTDLTHLKIRRCFIDHETIDYGHLFEEIWKLNQLTSFYFQAIRCIWNSDFISPQSSSSSIKSLHLEGFSYTAEQLNYLFARTMNLRTLNIDINHNYIGDEFPPMAHSIRSLKISPLCSIDHIPDFLQQMPNLIDLVVIIESNFINGYHWQEIIEDHLPNLKTFQMTTELFLYSEQNREEEVRRLLDTFRGPFWIDQHQWYVQCHWCASDESPRAYLYTLPYHSKRLKLASDLQFQSTCPNGKIYWCFGNVEKVLVENRTCPLIPFDHLKDLTVTFTLDECFYSSVWNVHQLKSLTVMLFKDVDSSIQLQGLLKIATNLSSLALEGKVSNREIIYGLRSSSIRRLDLHGLGSFDGDECEKLMNCCLGLACEVLMITVKDRHGIVALINGMKHLRALNIRSPENDKLIHWLKNYYRRLQIVNRESISGTYAMHIWMC